MESDALSKACLEFACRSRDGDNRARFRHPHHTTSFAVVLDEVARAQSEKRVGHNVKEKGRGDETAPVESSGLLIGGKLAAVFAARVALGAGGEVSARVLPCLPFVVPMKAKL